jgi:hypothetical protein
MISQNLRLGEVANLSVTDTLAFWRNCRYRIEANANDCERSNTLCWVRVFVPIEASQRAKIGVNHE